MPYGSAQGQSWEEGTDISSQSTEGILPSAPWVPNLTNVPPFGRHEGLCVCLRWAALTAEGCPAGGTLSRQVVQGATVGQALTYLFCSCTQCQSQ